MIWLSASQQMRGRGITHDRLPPGRVFLLFELWVWRRGRSSTAKLDREWIVREDKPLRHFKTIPALFSCPNQVQISQRRTFRRSIGEKHVIRRSHEGQAWAHHGRRKPALHRLGHHQGVARCGRRDGVHLSGRHLQEARDAAGRTVEPGRRDRLRCRQPGFGRCHVRRAEEQMGHARFRRPLRSASPTRISCAAATSTRRRTISG